MCYLNQKNPASLLGICVLYRRDPQDPRPSENKVSRSAKEYGSRNVFNDVRSATVCSGGSQFR
jgi:hypothetical protein